MALQPRLDLRQTQTLVMTPQLQQAIKLLQLSNMELSAFVEQELERNPMLERADGTADAEPEPRREDRPDADGGVLLDRTGGSEAPLDVEHDNTWDEGSALEGPSYDPDADLGGWSTLGPGGGGNGEGDGESGLENRLAEGRTFRDHVVEQIQMDLPGQADRLIATTLLDQLDECGYLRADLDAVAGDLGVPRDRVDRVLAACQRLDPAGIFARDLVECLRLQLIDRNRFDPCMAALLANLDKLAARDLAGLQAACGVDADDLREMIAELRALDPKPAFGFGGSEAQVLVPDVLMRTAPDGGWIVELNSETLPRVLVDARYHARISRAAKDRGDKTFITESFQTANWLVKALDQRANTILRVATEIVRQQDAFFVRGVAGLKPLILRDIAAAIEMHESTVSRVTSNKWIATPRGIFELKWFFTQAIGSSTGGDAHSAEAVRHRIKAMIDAEDPRKVLSDDALVEALQAEGIDIARRTVAKYRESMRIPSSVQRRREKAAAKSA